MLMAGKTQNGMLERNEGPVGMQGPGHTSETCWHSRTTHKDCRRPVILPLLVGVRMCQWPWRKRYIDSPYVVVVMWQDSLLL